MTPPAPTPEERPSDEAFALIESAALFHPEQAWPDEMKAQLRRIGKMAHEAMLAPPPASPAPPGISGYVVTKQPTSPSQEEQGT